MQLLAGLIKLSALLDTLLESYKDWNPRIIIPVIKSYAKSPDQPSIKRAFSIYLQLRERLGEDMTMDDFDAVSLAFMEAWPQSIRTGCVSRYDALQTRATIIRSKTICAFM